MSMALRRAPRNQGPAAAASTMAHSRCYEDRFVIPTVHREKATDAYHLRGATGFSFGNQASGGRSEVGLFGQVKRRTPKPVMEG